MAERRDEPEELSDALRDAVERTVESTLGSAGRSRDAAQRRRSDETCARARSRGSPRSRKARGRGIDTACPPPTRTSRELKAELRAIGRRLDAIEERLPGRRHGGRRKPAGERKPAAAQDAAS